MQQFLKHISKCQIIWKISITSIFYDCTYYCSKIWAQMEWKQNCYYKQTNKKQIKHLLDFFKHLKWNRSSVVLLILSLTLIWGWRQQLSQSSWEGILKLLPAAEHPQSTVTKGMFMSCALLKEHKLRTWSQWGLL